MGKGSRSRIKDRKKYEKNFEQINWDDEQDKIEQELSPSDYNFERHIK